jgi:dephospho-CoA kinase
MDGSGGVDRTRLAEIVFSDPTARDRLNRITHPRIVERLRIEICRYKCRESASNVLIVEIPLLYEGNLAGLVEKVIVVAAEQETQKNRLQMRSALSSEQADRRIASQMPVREKVKYADWVVDTEAGIEATRSQVRNIWRDLIRITDPGQQV